MNILYLDDYINFYNSNTKITHKIIPYKDTLRNGVIINKEKFINKMIKELNKIGIKNKLFASNIIVIINNYYSNEDKYLLKEIMEILNYKVNYVQECNYLIMNKNNIYINCNFSYFYILYVDIYGKVKINMYKNDVINKSLFINIINYFYGKDIFIYGKNSCEFIRILDRYKKNYYVFEEKNNLILEKILLAKSK